MGVINTGSFAKALWPGINKWYGEAYKEWPIEFQDLFDNFKQGIQGHVAKDDYEAHYHLGVAYN